MEKRFFSSNVDDKGILILEDSQTEGELIMGKLIQIPVNGEPFDLPPGGITAGDLKKEWGAPQDDWVYTRDGNGVHKVSDQSLITNDVYSVSIVPQHERGMR